MCVRTDNFSFASSTSSLLYANIGTCEYCLAGHETVCERQQTTGLSVPGTFQEYVIAKAQGLARIPSEVDFDQAAPILCAGISVYKGLKELDMKAGQWVCVPGAGGGMFGIVCLVLVLKSVL